MRTWLCLLSLPYLLPHLPVGDSPDCGEWIVGSFLRLLAVALRIPSDEAPWFPGKAMCGGSWVNHASGNGPSGNSHPQHGDSHPQCDCADPTKHASFLGRARLSPDQSRAPERPSRTGVKVPTLSQLCLKNPLISSPPFPNRGWHIWCREFVTANITQSLRLH